MVIWLNGTFGVGKSSVTDELLAMIPNALLFDPEEVGFLLRRILPNPTGDFQDLPPWRRLTITTIAEIHTYTRQTLLVPMTLLNQAYAEEIFAGLEGCGIETVHVLLHAADAALRTRINKHIMFPDDPARDTEVRRWRLDHIDAYEKAFGWLTTQAYVIDTTSLTPRHVAESVAKSGLIRRPVV